MTTQPLWNWQQPDWPTFRYERARLEALERAFLHESGVFRGAIRHVGEEDEQFIRVSLISDEAMQTSEIEGEMLNRDSLQSSIRRNFGLATDHRRVPPAEQGIAQMMVELYGDSQGPLTVAMLFHWHELLMKGRRDLKQVGAWRKDAQPMQVVSGPLHAPKVHFEAPPSAMIPQEMKRFVKWFNGTAPGGKTPLPLLTRAGIAHLYFESLHPFEDGNGRIGRAISEKVLSQGLGQSSLVALSHAINAKRKTYYEMLERSSKHNEITAWLVYFAQTVLEAQAHAQGVIDFLIAKTKFLDQLKGRLNERQEKALLRVLREGPEGFAGGLSAEKYIRITGTSRATATRDLQDLVEKQALIRTGALKSTRYQLPLHAGKQAGR